MVQFRVEEVPEGPAGADQIPLETLPKITITGENGTDTAYVKVKTEEESENDEGLC